MAYSLERIIKGFEEFSKTSQFQCLANSFRNRGQDHFSTIVTLTVALCSQQGTKPALDMYSNSLILTTSLYLPPSLAFSRACASCEQWHYPPAL